MKPKSRYEENMKNIYTQMVDNERQKNHAFGISEKRFDWVHNYSNGNDLNNHKKIIRTHKDNLEGGLGRYLNKISLENEIENQKKNNTLKNKNISQKKALKYLNLNSQRVIYPEKDTEIKKVNKKRTYGSQEKNLLHITDGRITSLLDKTPLRIRYGGKKTFNNSVDYGRKRDTALFSEAFLNDKKYNRIPGVKRKHLIHKVNLETQPLDEFSMGRKHFCFYKDID